MRLIRELSDAPESMVDGELDYFYDIIEQFITVAKRCSLDPKNKVLNLIARSPNSNIFTALDNYAENFIDLGIEMNVVFNQIEPGEILCDWLDPENSPCGTNPSKHIRWSGETDLDDAHEQLALGSLISWTGESMRRESSTRYGFYILNENCENTARIAQHSFTALWRIAKTIPETRNFRTKLASDGAFCINGSEKNLTISFENSIYIPSDNTRH